MCDGEAEEKEAGLRVMWLVAGRADGGEVWSGWPGWSGLAGQVW